MPRAASAATMFAAIEQAYDWTSTDAIFSDASAFMIATYISPPAKTSPP